MSKKYEILDEQAKEYRRFNTWEHNGSSGLNPLYWDRSCNHFLASVNEWFAHVLQNVRNGHMVGITKHNEVKQSDKPIGISFRRKDQLSGDVIWSVF